MEVRNNKTTYIIIVYRTIEKSKRVSVKGVQGVEQEGKSVEREENAERVEES